MGVQILVLFAEILLKGLSLLLCIATALLSNQLAVLVDLFLGCAFCSFDLSVLLQIPHCLDYHSFLANLKVCSVSPSTLFSFNIMLFILGLLPNLSILMLKNIFFNIVCAKIV